MENEFAAFDKMLSEIRVTSNPNNKPVTIHGSSKELSCIGVGTDAAVFQCMSNPTYAIKLYAEGQTNKIQTEAKVYQKLDGISFFSKCYIATNRYLILGFESGITLYDCLLQGVPIPKQVIDDVEEARYAARQRGLNPRDIHLKNVLLQDGRAKVIDVSEYLKPGNDLRWDHLKKGYEEYYYLIEGKAIPYWILETVRKWYYQRNYESIDEFMKKILSLKLFNRSG